MEPGEGEGVAAESEGKRGGAVFPKVKLPKPPLSQVERPGLYEKGSESLRSSWCRVGCATCSVIVTPDQGAGCPGPCDRNVVALALEPRSILSRAAARLFTAQLQEPCSWNLP